MIPYKVTIIMTSNTGVVGQLIVAKWLLFVQAHKELMFAYKSVPED